MNIALIRTMDSQGRIVIPAEIRKQMKLSDGDALELENVGMELLLRKCPTHLNGKEESLIIRCHHPRSKFYMPLLSPRFISIQRKKQ